MLCGGDVLQSFNATKENGERLWTDQEIEAEQCMLPILLLSLASCEGSCWPTWSCLRWAKRIRSGSMGRRPRWTKEFELRCAVHVFKKARFVELLDFALAADATNSRN